MQSLIHPLVSRSSVPSLTARKPKDLSANKIVAEPPVTDKAALYPQTPFQSAMLFYQLRQSDEQTKAAYVAYLHKDQLLHLERLHTLKGHNPAINCQLVIQQAQQWGASQVVLASGVETTSEEPYAVEFADEVERQCRTLQRAQLQLMDCLRISLTGAYSYYGDHNGPFENAPEFHQRGLSRLY